MENSSKMKTPENRFRTKITPRLDIEATTLFIMSDYLTWVVKTFPNPDEDKGDRLARTMFYQREYIKRYLRDVVNK